jgi:hypothetical protein
MNVGEWTTKRAFNQPERLFLKDEDGRVFNNRVFNERVNRTAHAWPLWASSGGSGLPRCS